MRFRKRVNVFPGFHLNFSSSGISSTFGGKGASIHFSKRGTYLNVKVPGNGNPDKRFSNNYEIPIAKYGAVELRSDSGLYESYSFSNYEKAEAFFKQFMDYKNAL